MEAWLTHYAQIIADNYWLAPFITFFAGVLTSFTPCSLSGVPLVIGYIGGSCSKDAKKAFGYSVIFAIGTAITFVTMGIIASSVGMLMGTASPVWYTVLGCLMILMTLQTWGIFNFIPSTNLLAKNKKQGIIGALTAGVLAGLFASPCSTSVLIALLGIIAGKGNFAWGVLLMVLYSLGHSLLVIMAGTSIGFVQKVNSSNLYGKTGNIMTFIMGMLILLVGFYMFWLVF